MHVHFLDPYRPGHSAVHRLDARVKLILVLAFILTCALTPTGAWPVYVILFSLVLAVEILSELGVISILKRSSLAIPFILAAFPLLFTIQGAPLFRLTLGPWILAASVEGLNRFASIAFKSWLSVQAAILLATSTPFPELLQAMRAIRIPRLLVAIFGLMWRYLFVLADETIRLLRARASRSGQSSDPRLKTGGGLAWRARITGGMAGNLFLRAFERSDRIYMAMLARGYDGEVRALPLPTLGVSQRLLLACGLTILFLLLILAFFIT